MKQSFTFVVVGFSVGQVHASVTSVLESSKSESFSAGRRVDVTHQCPRGKGEGGASQGGAAVTASVSAEVLGSRWAGAGRSKPE